MTKHRIPFLREFPWIIPAQFNPHPMQYQLQTNCPTEWPPLNDCSSRISVPQCSTINRLVAMLGKSKWVFILPQCGVCYSKNQEWNEFLYQLNVLQILTLLAKENRSKKLFQQDNWPTQTSLANPCSLYSPHFTAHLWVMSRKEI